MKSAWHFHLCHLGAMKEPRDTHEFWHILQKCWHICESLTSLAVGEAYTDMPVHGLISDIPIHWNVTCVKLKHLVE